MPSPFPGMNPYLEQPAVWQDFHNALVLHIREALMPQVRPQFIVKLEEFVFIHEPPAEERGKLVGRPDVSILSDAGSRAVAVAEPRSENLAAIIAQLPDVEIEKHSYIEIRDRQNRDLITLIEVLSPSNKQYGPDRETYSSKRSVLMHSPTSLVEIDLLRHGPRFPLKGIDESDYRVMVSRRAMRPDVLAWAIQLSDRLPQIPIPLRGDFPDAQLDLQTLLDEVYDAAGYADYLYATPPDPPLTDEQNTWAQQFVPSASTETASHPADDHTESKR